MTSHAGTNAPEFVPSRWGWSLSGPTQTGCRANSGGFGARWPSSWISDRRASRTCTLPPFLTCKPARQVQRDLRPSLPGVTLFPAQGAASCLSAQRPLETPNCPKPPQMSDVKGKREGTNSMGQTEPNSKLFADFRRFLLCLGITVFRKPGFSQKRCRFSQQPAGNRRISQEPSCPS